MQEIILASASERRHRLLENMGVPFKIEEAHVEEVKLTSPEDTVMQNAWIKAKAVHDKSPNRIILSADTVVAIDGQILGKPKDAEDAKSMLSRLSGRWHAVYTGVCLISQTGEKDIKLCTTRVHMAEISQEEIEAYVLTGEPMDKAGSYAMQGIAGAFVTEIQGNYANVIGLPTSMVRDMLKDINYY
ncbi:MAG: Maf family protein [Eubacteriales bacterium]|nr:Maf family protein [Eubacteriales bacterium]